MEKYIIRVENLRRDFVVGGETVHALRGVSFSIREGEFVTIMGTSGSGKSTLLNLLGCLDTATAGEYYLDGISVREMSRNDRATLRNRKIGFVFQSYNLLPKTTALENVELPLFYNPSVSARDRKERSINALHEVGLADRIHHRSNQMSGGQQQRVAIARALVNDPVMILDVVRDPDAFSKAAQGRAYDRFRNAQSGDRRVLQPQHRAARRADRRGRAEYASPFRQRSTRFAAAGQRPIKRGL